ncbi:hypothetical protein GQ53DRAFT_54232 [Thozetella sp. PMI_491]|nr:hypothetical protein GQ53DRAFT_54232 [Thozetella sp. PMI_491]
MLGLAASRGLGFESVPKAGLPAHSFTGQSGRPPGLSFGLDYFQAGMQAMLGENWYVVEYVQHKRTSTIITHKEMLYPVSRAQLTNQVNRTAARLMGFENSHTCQLYNRNQVQLLHFAFIKILLGEPVTAIN